MVCQHQRGVVLLTGLCLVSAAYLALFAGWQPPASEPLSELQMAAVRGGDPCTVQVTTEGCDESPKCDQKDKATCEAQTGTIFCCVSDSTTDVVTNLAPFNAPDNYDEVVTRGGCGDAYFSPSIECVWDDDLGCYCTGILNPGSKCPNNRVTYYECDP